MTAMIITINQRDGEGTVMAIRTHFDSLAGMEQVLAMGIEEGMRCWSCRRSTQSSPARLREGLTRPCIIGDRHSPPPTPRYTRVGGLLQGPLLC